MIWPYSGGRRTPRPRVRIDEWLPATAVELEHHAVRVRADPAGALAAIDAVGLHDLPVVRLLFTLRGLPHDARGRVRDFFGTPPFVLLETVPGREVVFGVLGPFWRWGWGRTGPRVASTADEFRQALRDGCMAAVGNYRVEPDAGGSLLWTETWVTTSRAADRATFAAYWLAIGPFSAWIRRLMLRAAARRAAASARATGP